jgi:hypothetical protein
VRVNNLFGFFVKEAPGSEGEKSECWRMLRIDPKVSAHAKGEREEGRLTLVTRVVPEGARCVE